MCNCLTYCISQKIKHGGKIKVSKSRTWLGFHTIWVDKNGNKWEYTLSKPKKQPWWYVPLCYKGVVKRVK